MSESSYKLNIDQVRRFLPHRAPFLLVDRVLEIHPTGPLGTLEPEGKAGTRVVALKAISYNEPVFQGHFPQFSVFPGVMIIEAMGQASSFSILPYMAHDLDRMARDFSCILVGVDNARFRRPVIPGDLMRLESVVTKVRGKLWMFECKAFVDGQLVAEANIMANLIPNKEQS